MREHYWGAMHTLVYQHNYAAIYYKLIIRAERIVSILIAITSAASVASWTIWNNLSVPWAVLIMVVQLFQIIWPMLPFAKQISGLKYYLNDLKQIILDAETFWYTAENQESPDYIEALRQFRQRQLVSESRYLGVEPLPVLSRLEDRADEMTLQHLRLFFGVNEGSETDGN